MALGQQVTQANTAPKNWQQFQDDFLKPGPGYHRQGAYMLWGELCKLCQEEKLIFKPDQLESLRKAFADKRTPIVESDVASIASYIKAGKAVAPELIKEIAGRAPEIKPASVPTKETPENTSKTAIQPAVVSNIEVKEEANIDYDEKSYEEATKLLSQQVPDMPKQYSSRYQKIIKLNFKGKIRAAREEIGGMMLPLVEIAKKIVLAVKDSEPGKTVESHLKDAEELAKANAERRAQQSLREAKAATERKEEAASVINEFKAADAHEKVRSYQDNTLINKLACLSPDQFKELINHSPKVEKVLKEKIMLFNSRDKHIEAIPRSIDQHIKLENTQKIGSHLKIIMEKEALAKTQALATNKAAKKPEETTKAKISREIVDEALSSLKFNLLMQGQTQGPHHLAAIMKATHLPNMTAADLKAKKSELIKAAVNQALIAKPPIPHDLTPKPPFASPSLQASSQNLVALSARSQTIASADPPQGKSPEKPKQGSAPAESKYGPRPS